jgi:FixJ family two-component response regulator
VASRHADRARARRACGRHAGRLNKQIAGDLGIVEQTVKCHRAHIMDRTQARTAAELMGFAATLGIY